MSNPSFPLTKEQFVQWLAERNDDDICGIAGVCHSCPIAEAASGGDGPYIEVGKFDWWFFSAPLVLRPLPMWAQTFIQTIDGPNPMYTPITVAMARAALEGEAGQ